MIPKKPEARLHDSSKFESSEAEKALICCIQLRRLFHKKNSNPFSLKTVHFFGKRTHEKVHHITFSLTIKFSFIKTLWCTLFPVILQEEGTCFPVVNFIPSTGRVYSVSRKRDLSWKKCTSSRKMAAGTCYRRWIFSRWVVKWVLRVLGTSSPKSHTHNHRDLLGFRGRLEAQSCCRTCDWRRSVSRESDIGWAHERTIASDPLLFITVS